MPAHVKPPLLMILVIILHPHRRMFVLN
jgi:hypothetical protein